jgi:hypothetical protein
MRTQLVVSILYTSQKWLTLYLLTMHIDTWYIISKVVATEQTIDERVLAYLQPTREVLIFILLQRKYKKRIQLILQISNAHSLPVSSCFKPNFPGFVGRDSSSLFTPTAFRPCFLPLGVWFVIGAFIVMFNFFPGLYPFRGIVLWLNGRRRWHCSKKKKQKTFIILTTLIFN